MCPDPTSCTSWPVGDSISLGPSRAGLSSASTLAQPSPPGHPQDTACCIGRLAGTAERIMSWCLARPLQATSRRRPLDESILNHLHQQVSDTGPYSQIWWERTSRSILLHLFWFGRGTLWAIVRGSPCFASGITTGELREPYGMLGI